MEQDSINLSIKVKKQKNNMAIITKIQEQRNKKRVNIFIDDAFFCGLNKETAVIFRLKVGLEVDEELIKDAIFDSEVKSAVEKANDYIGTRMHSKRELYEKLLKKGYKYMPYSVRVLEELRTFSSARSMVHSFRQHFEAATQSAP